MKFNSLFTPVEKTGLDYSNQFEDVYEELPPYAIDVETGEFLNKSSAPVVLKTGQINVYEKIQSYADDVDIYKILEKFALSGDTSLINRTVGSFGDFVNIPDNINDFSKLIDNNIKSLKKLDPKLANAVVSENIDKSDLEALIKEQVAAALIKAQNNNNNVEGGANNE